MDDGRLAGLREVRAQPFADRLDGLDLARLVVLPQSGEAPQLALEVALRLAEALEPGGAPVGGVHLDQGVDQLVGDATALLRRGELAGQGVGHDHPLDLLHDVEGGADDGLVVTDRQHRGDAHATAVERRDDPRLAQDVVRGRRQRGSRRPAQDDLRAVLAAHDVGDVRVPVADRLDRQLAAPQPRRVQERHQRLGHDERHAQVALGLGVRADDVVGSDVERHSLGSCRTWTSHRPTAARSSPSASRPSWTRRCTPPRRCAEEQLAAGGDPHCRPPDPRGAQGRGALARPVEPLPSRPRVRARADQRRVRAAGRDHGPLRRPRARGDQLLGARHGQHGGPHAVRHRRSRRSGGCARCSTARSARRSR